MPKREDNPSSEELRREASASEREGKVRDEGKNPGNVAGGKKAAASRKERGSSGRRSIKEDD